jgi:HEAT repeat protein
MRSLELSRWRASRWRRAQSPTERLLALDPAVGCDSLLAAAHDPSVDVARHALGWLAQLGGPAECAALREWVWSCDPALVADVAVTLRRLGDRDTVAEAIRRLKGGKAAERCRAVWVIGRLGDREAVPALCHALGDGDETVRGAALDALAKAGRDGRAAEAAVALVTDDRAEVRRRAVHALGRLSSAAGDYVREAIDDPHPRVRHEVALLAGRLSPEDVARLLADREAEVRRAAAGSSGRNAEQCLITSLATDPHPLVRLAAAQGLGHVRSESAAEALVTAAVDDRDALVRERALRLAEEALTHERLVVALRRRLCDEPPRRRAMALRAVSKLDARVTPAEAETLAHDPDPDVRLALAQHAMRVVPSPAKVFAVLARDPDSNVRHAAEIHALREP